MLTATASSRWSLQGSTMTHTMEAGGKEGRARRRGVCAVKQRIQ